MDVDQDLSMEKFFSIIIPSFNRAWCIERAILSAVAFLKGHFRSEIIVVDDGSKDGTPELVKTIFEKLKKQNVSVELVLIRNVANLGVCAAKNAGSRFAVGKWLVFLDSDDELVAESFSEVCRSLKLNEELPLHFFRCIDGNSLIVPGLSQSRRRSFLEYLNSGTDGEALPIIERRTFLKFPYDEDISGYESLSYIRIASNYKYVCIHSLIARRYHTDHSDRLSVKSNFKKRSGSLAKGHLRVLSEHFSEMSVLMLFKYALKFFKMKIISLC